ncbi:MAG: hypothetical protein SFY67_02735 [Candidatus Melainabacteria bacterium]|nr:hypothetical protein [Candidatus Melainabacteria bacterium]
MNLSTLTKESTQRLTHFRGRKDLSSAQMKALAAAIIIMQLALLCVFCMHVLMIPAEAAEHLHFAVLVLQGKTPYKDVVDMVSPMMLYLDVIPAYVSKLTHIHPIFVFNLFVWILSCLSQYLCLSVLFKSQSREKYFYSIVLLANCLLQFVFISEFGQIDHLFLLFIIPYWLTRTMRWNGQKPDNNVSMIVGVFAAIGFSLSFLYSIFFAILEICFWLEKRKADAFTGSEFTCCSAIMFLYIGHMIILPESIAGGYLGWILPLTFLDYWQWDDRLSFIEKTPDRRDLIYLFALVSVLAMAQGRKTKIMIPSLIFAVFGFGLYIIQGQMFTFQALPMMWGVGFAVALLCAIAFTLLPDSGKLVNVKVVVPVVSLACAIFVYVQYIPVSKCEKLDLSEQDYWGSAPKCDLSNFSEFFEKYTKAGDKVLILNDRTRPAYPLMLQLGLQPAWKMLDYTPSRIYETYAVTDQTKAIQKFIYYENSIWEELPSKVLSDPPKVVMYDEEAMNPLLEKHLLKQRLIDVYGNPLFADWNENIDKHPKFEYLSFRFPIAAHVKK